MKKSEIAVLIIILLSFALSIYSYPNMPPRVASHWNVKGQVDDYMPKFWGAFLMPFVLIVLALIFFIIPKIDPLKKNIEKFRRHYDNFVILFSMFMLIVHAQTVLWNLGFRINPNILLPLGIGPLFYYAGILCENAKRNWSIGIRTPWTLSREKVWNKTHKIGGKLFKLAGIITLIGGFFQEYAIYFILVPITLAVAYLILYSYVEYQKEKKIRILYC